MTTKAGRRLPVLRRDPLDALTIDSPCTYSWEEMEGDRWIRHCPACDLDVYDVSALPRAEALALIERNEGRLCVQLVRRRDGTVVTDGCWARVREARRRGRGALLLALLVVAPLMLWAQLKGFGFVRGWWTARSPRATRGAPPEVVTDSVAGPRGVTRSESLPILGRPQVRAKPGPEPVEEALAPPTNERPSRTVD